MRISPAPRVKGLSAQDYRSRPARENVRTAPAGGGADFASRRSRLHTALMLLSTSPDQCAPTSSSAPAVPAATRPTCLHCGRTSEPVGRGLCRGCHNKIGVRRLYPCLFKSRKQPISPRCRHCGIFKQTRPRGLCRKCHKNKGIRRLYGPVSAHGRRTPVWQDKVGPRSLPPEPTAARPGSVEKMLVLQHRISRGYKPWHPLDAPCDPEIAHSRPVAAH
jgi:hypothetical protein